MLQRRTGILVMVLVLAIVLGSTGLLFARDGREMIEVFYRNIGIRVHGSNIPIAPENEPFIYQGRTYVPLRLISEALGYDVDWDGDTFTVLIGGTAQQVTTGIPFLYHNETTTYNNWEYRVIDVKHYSVLSSGASTYRPDGSFVVALLRIQNLGKAARPLGNSFFTVEDEKEITYQMHNHHSANYSRWNNMESDYRSNIQPSSFATVPVAFDVPEDTKRLIMYPPNITEAELQVTKPIVLFDER